MMDEEESDSLHFLSSIDDNGVVLWFSEALDFNCIPLSVENDRIGAMIWTTEEERRIRIGGGGINSIVLPLRIDSVKNAYTI